LDELWTFIAKKEARLTSLEKLAAIAGDAWVWIAFSPVEFIPIKSLVATGSGAPGRIFPLRFLSK